MKPYSQFLNQARKGQNNWTNYLKLFLIAWMGPFLLNNILKGIVPFSGGIIGEFFNNNLFAQLLTLFLFWLLFTRYHGRPLESLVNTSYQFDWSKFAYGVVISAGLVFGLGAISLLVLYDQPVIWAWNSGKAFYEFLIPMITVPVGILVYHLFFRAYMLQGIAQWQRKPWNAILVLAALMWIVDHLYLLWFAIIGYLPFSEMSFSWFFNSYILVNFFILIIVVLDEGIELGLSFSMGNALYLMLVDQQAIGAEISVVDKGFFSDNFAYFFNYSWGALVCLALFLLIVTRKYKLKSSDILSEEIPAIKQDDEKYDLIDQIGKE